MILYGVLLILSKAFAQVTLVDPAPKSAYQDSVHKKIKENAAAFQACYKEEIDSNAKFSTELFLKWTINEKGHVIKADVVEATTPSTKFADCLIRKVNNIVFAPTPDNRPMDIKFPMMFKLKKPIGED